LYFTCTHLQALYYQCGHWTIVPPGSRHGIVRKVKLCGSHVQDDDGITRCNSQDALITDCFIRSGALGDTSVRFGLLIPLREDD
jgi:hypothetical protein